MNVGVRNPGIGTKPVTLLEPPGTPGAAPGAPVSHAGRGGLRVVRAGAAKPAAKAAAFVPGTSRSRHKKALAQDRVPGKPGRPTTLTPAMFQQAQMLVRTHRIITFKQFGQRALRAGLRGGPLDQLFDPDLILDIDESAVATGDRRGEKYVVLLHSRRRPYVKYKKHVRHHTVLCGISAAGRALPPMLLFPRATKPTDLPDLVNEFFRMGGTRKGWITPDTLP
ncbi:hypothetical protein PAPYR_8236 [Paratrimastix pyriformis]|uniref:Transposase n=1 Tax=Paratrimastix pyriformis TaxID=342808 RepID=A0ABQ8UGQ2_9EUKA|nr:hypothetical protein PAPYR_8236 [Paratrimastix pyriformis]